MNVLIIEDESRAANHLERVLKKVAPEAMVLGRLESVAEALDFFRGGHSPELIFSDIELADGLSFEIYQQVEVPCPIVFTTAYDQYAIEAFQTNGIDYLLKPVEEQRLAQALDKVRRLQPKISPALLQSLFPTSAPKKRERFLVKVGDSLKSISTGDILAFFSLDKATFLLTTEGRRYVLDLSIGEVEKQLGAGHFFRINRRHILSLEACQHIHAFTNSRLIVKVPGLEDQEVIVARERVADFKDWLGA